jgi:release factor glutamine methyltransferase
MSGSLGEAERRAARLLAEEGCPSPHLDARLLLQAATGLSREALLIDPNRRLVDEERERFDTLLERRRAGEPVSRILGRREFWSLDFALSPATLDPRADSETLVASLLEQIQDRQAPLRLLDLGTGTGCLLLALLAELPHASGMGIDLAPQAVETAQENAARLGLAGRAQFRQGDWRQGIAGSFDLIVSNPPYIPSARIASLAREVRDFDPALALDGGEDGLEAYRQLAQFLPPCLVPGGIAALETGIGQAPQVVEIFQTSGLNVLGIKQDLSGIERAVLLRRPAT